MPSESFPAERIAVVTSISLLGFALERAAVQWLLMPTLWPRGWAKLSPATQQDFALKSVSVTHSVITAYNSYFVLVDPYMQENVLQHVSDQHFLAVSVLLGYFLFDTAMSFYNMAAEDEAAGALQTLFHHVCVLAGVPVGLCYNTWAWMGTGVLATFTEVTGPSLNMIWILRTLGGDTHWLYLLNGVVFGVSFIFIRVVVLTYYVYVYVVLMHAHWGVSEGEPSTGKVTIELAPFPLGGSHFTLSSPQVHDSIDCSIWGSACQGGFVAFFGVWAVSMLWVPAVLRKLTRGLVKALAPAAAAAPASDHNGSKDTTAQKQD